MDCYDFPRPTDCDAVPRTSRRLSCSRRTSKSTRERSRRVRRTRASVESMLTLTRQPLSNLGWTATRRSKRIVRKLRHQQHNPLQCLHDLVSPLAYGGHGTRIHEHPQHLFPSRIISMTSLVFCSNRHDPDMNHDELVEKGTPALMKDQG